jgi:hypothetical protein
MSYSGRPRPHANVAEKCPEAGISRTDVRNIPAWSGHVLLDGADIWTGGHGKISTVEGEGFIVAGNEPGFFKREEAAFS